MKLLRRGLLAYLYGVGWLERFRPVWGRECLTVLAYHRLGNARPGGGDSFQGNISANLDQFELQLDFLQRHFQLVSLEQVLAWRRGQASLPPQAALLTFDDGYADNYHLAFPAFGRRQIPAVIFLATGYIGQDQPFFWDLVAYCFHHTAQTEVILPVLGRQTWPDEPGKNRVMAAWLQFLKKQADPERRNFCAQLPAWLGVTVAEDSFKALYLTWEQVGVMGQQQVAFAAHTHTHPIMTTLSLPQARQEARQSKQEIEARTGQPVAAFAYPNGQAGDFSPAVAQLLAAEGFELAFTLLPGPARASEVAKSPLLVRRVAVHYRDDLPRFAAKVFGLTRLFGRPR